MNMDGVLLSFYAKALSTVLQVFREFSHVVRMETSGQNYVNVNVNQRMDL